eukprot:TRINITY_DN5559_c0_g1_i2.p1 TRINITY_DN5559_c0_g1~~TRINITY_DN5559_c0_g1_i2.p1  ORF type:complete len:320 (+),score=57.05 TRINITY_DN5559_c0_g1_i2:170-1129(+)
MHPPVVGLVIASLGDKGFVAEQPAWRAAAQNATLSLGGGWTPRDARQSAQELALSASGGSSSALELAASGAVQQGVADRRLWNEEAAGRQAAVSLRRRLEASDWASAVLLADDHAVAEWLTLFGGFKTRLFICCGLGAVVLCIASLLALMQAWAERLPGAEREKLENARGLCACFLGLCTSMVLYGIAQEYVMTKDYSGEMFPSATFLVFCNRACMLVPALAAILWRREALLPPGAMMCGIPAVALCVSTSCQYASLRYITFPTQVIFKCGKLGPTMLFNRIINGTQHSWRDIDMDGLTFLSFSCLSRRHGDSKHLQIY